MSLSTNYFEHSGNPLSCFERANYRRIMLVDDEPSILLSAQRCLANSDYSIDAFESPIEALKHAKHNAYDLIITDQRMPQMDGIELLTKINDIQPNCIGIILSGFNDSSTLIDAINKAHIYQYVCKPWRNADFQRLVENALDFGEAQTEIQRLADRARVNNGSMTKHRAQLRELEAKYPGITQVERDESGAIILKAGVNSPKNTE